MKVKKLLKKVLKLQIELLEIEKKKIDKEESVLAVFDKERGLVVDEKVEPLEAVAYIDGSYNHAENIGGYGIVLLLNGKTKKYSSIINVISGELTNANSAEIHAAGIALELAASRRITKLTIKYDFVGVKDWLLNDSDNPRAQWYRKMYDIYTKNMNVFFEKVDAHTGVVYNEMADQLAKMAVRRKMAELEAKLEYEKNMDDTIV